MKANKQNIILDSINYLKIFLPLHIGQAISDPLKVSYISQGKIKGIKENTGIEISNRPTDDQRNKYFTATSIEKLLKKLFVVNTSDESKKMYDVVNNIDDYLKQNLDYNFFVDTDVSGFYSNEPENYNGSCMAGKPESYFELYDYINDHPTNDVEVKIVGFKTQDLVLARGLLWCKTYRDALGGITAKAYFLDRIYIHNKLQNSSFAKLQFELYQTIRKYYKADELRAFNKTQIESYILHKYDNTSKFIFKCKISYPSFAVNIEGYEETLSRYPYMDTFKYIDESEVLSIDDCDDTVKILDQTDGHFTESNNCCCDECGDAVHRDESIYSELDDQTLCDDCAVYVDERDSYANRNNTYYNDYSGSYHHEDDISRA
jgi:hypothetical protein